MEELAHTELLASATGSKRKNMRASNKNEKTTTTPTPTNAINAFDVLMATAKRNATVAAQKAVGASKRRRKSKNAFEVMMENAKIPGVFESPTAKLLLEGCKNVANLVRVAAAATTDKEASKYDDYANANLVRAEKKANKHDDDDDDGNNEDGAAVNANEDASYDDDDNDDNDNDSGDDEYYEDFEDEALLGLEQDCYVSDTCDEVCDMGIVCRKEIKDKNIKANIKAMFDEVIFAASPHPNMTEFDVDAGKNQTGKGAYVTKVSGHFDMRLKRQVIVALSFHYSDGTEIIYDNGGDVKCAKVTEFSLEEGEHLVSLETCHFSLPRMLQSMILHTNKERSFSLGEQKHSPLVPIHRTFKAENNHVIRGLEWLAEESTILLLQTQPLNDIRLAKPRDESSLVHLAHEREYKRLREHAADVKTRAMKDVNKNWLQVRNQVHEIGEKYQDLLRETDEAKALNEIKIVQVLLHERFDKKAKLLKLKAKKEMDAALKQGQEKEQGIKAKYISDGSECLQEHQSVVTHLSKIGLECYTSMKTPTVCSNLACRKTFDLATLSSTKRCSVLDCASIKVPNCGCQVHRCPVCNESCCNLHYKDHQKWCLWNLEKKCGWDKKTGTLKPFGCHKRSVDRASLLTCHTCAVQCCVRCCHPCTWCDDMDMDSEDADYVYCKQCQFTLGHETLCSGCYHDACRE